MKEKEALNSLPICNSGFFPNDDKDFGRTDKFKYAIDTGFRIPLRQSFRTTQVHSKDQIYQNIDDMLKEGVIEKSTNP